MRSTLATRLARVIQREYVDSGMLRRGDPLPSIRELQALFGGSVTTLAHALGQLEAQGVVEKRHGRGCFLRRDAHDALADQSTRTLGVVVPQPGLHEMMARLYSGIALGAEREGFRIMMATRPAGIFEEAVAVERESVSQLVDAGCDAIVMAPSPRTHAGVENDYLAHEFRDTPIALVDLALPEHGRVQIVFDNRSAGRDMTRLLLDAGHEHVAFTHFRSEGREVVWRSIAERQQGYADALRERGRAPRRRDYWVIDHRASWMDEYGNPKPNVIEFLRQWQSEPDHATAVVTCMDHLAIALIQGAHALGIRVPEELDVTGFDNMAQGQMVRPAFPTTNPDFAAAGEKAVELVAQLLADEIHEPATFIMPVPILARRGSREGTVSIMGAQSPDQNPDSLVSAMQSEDGRSEENMSYAD